jgi:hypothetical protein
LARGAYPNQIDLRFCDPMCCRQNRCARAAARREAHLEHEQAKAELKGLMPEDAKEAIGHGIRAKRSKSGAVSFDLLTTQTQEAGHAAV